MQAFINHGTMVCGNASNYRESEVLQKEDVLTVDEASELLRVSVNSIRASLAKGQLPGAKVGREWRLSRHVPKPDQFSEIT